MPCPKDSFGADWHGKEKYTVFLSKYGLFLSKCVVFF